MLPDLCGRDLPDPGRWREYRAYLQGALHDGTRNPRHRTHRFAQKGTEWLLRLQALLAGLGHRSLVAPVEQAASVRAYFDAEGGVPHSPEARFYVQICQKVARN